MKDVFGLIFNAGDEIRTEAGHDEKGDWYFVVYVNDKYYGAIKCESEAEVNKVWEDFAKMMSAIGYKNHDEKISNKLH